MSGLCSKPLSPTNKQYEVSLKEKEDAIKHKRNFSYGEEPISYRKDNFLVLKEKEKPSNFNKGFFNYRYVIGKGGFGKVWKV